MLLIVSLILSAAIVGFAVHQGRIRFGAYRLAIRGFDDMRLALTNCPDGDAFGATLRQWLNHESVAVRILARRLSRLCDKKPVRVGARLGWSMDLDQLCDGRRLAREQTGHEILQAMPGILTGAGILFTFLGLTLGISGLDPTDPAQMASGVKNLLGGMSLAFLTSLAGIGSALWWSWASRLLITGFESAIAELSQVLGHKPFIILPDELNDHFIEVQGKQAQALAGLGDSVTAGILKAIEELGWRELTLELRRALNAEKGGVDVLGAISDLRRSTLRLNAYLKEQTETNKALTEYLKRMIRQDHAPVSGMEPVGFFPSVAPDQGAITAAREISNAQILAGQTIVQAVQQLSAQMETVRQLHHEMVEVGQKLGTGQERLEAQWTHFRGQLKAIQDRFDQTLARFGSELGQSLKGVHSQVDELLADSLNHFSAALGEMDRSLDLLAMVAKGEPGRDRRDKREPSERR